jgi:kynureninase
MTLASGRAARPDPSLIPSLARYRSEFPVFADTIYLNTCSLGALGSRSRRKVTEFLDCWEKRGASAWYDVWWEALQDLRTRYARLIGAQGSEIALAPNISTAVGTVASAIDYRTRPKVVVTSLDFPTVAYQWLARRPEGVEVVVVESPDGVTVPVEAIARAVDARTALVATSHVFFTTGAIQDIHAVAQAAHAQGALCLIDAYHSVGQLPVEVRDAGVDFLVAGGLKWLLGGPGVVFLYVRDALARSLEPTLAGWFGHKDQFAFDPRGFARHDDARRFELGTPALAAVHAQLGGLEYIEEIGVPAIRQASMALAEDLIARAHDRGWKPRIARNAADRSAIVMLPSPDPHAAVRHLAQAHIVADARPGHVRLSPFFYNLQEDHVAAIEQLAQIDH